MTRKCRIGVHGDGFLGDSPRQITFPNDVKVPITYSVFIDLERSDIFAAPSTALISDRVAEALKCSGVFSNVRAVS